MDLESYGRWYDYSRARDAMFAATDTETAPWYVADSNDKRRARLNIISHILDVIPYNANSRRTSSCHLARRRATTESRTRIGTRCRCDFELRRAAFLSPERQDCAGSSISPMTRLRRRPRGTVVLNPSVGGSGSARSGASRSKPSGMLTRPGDVPRDVRQPVLPHDGVVARVDHDGTVGGGRRSP